MSKNIEMKEKLSDGSYDPLYPKTKANLTSISDAGNYFNSTNVEDVFQEIGASQIKYVKTTVSKTATAAGQVNISAAASTFIPAGATVVDISAQVAAGSDTAKINGIFIYNNTPVAIFNTAATLSFVVTVLYILN